MGLFRKIGFEPGDSRGGEAKSGKFRKQELMVDNVKGLRDVEEGYTNEFLAIKGLVPLVTTPLWSGLMAAHFHWVGK